MQRCDTTKVPTVTKASPYSSQAHNKAIPTSPLRNAGRDGQPSHKVGANSTKDGGSQQHHELVTTRSTTRCSSNNKDRHKGDLGFPSPQRMSRGITKFLGQIGRSSPPPSIPQVWGDLVGQGGRSTRFELKNNGGERKTSVCSDLI